MKSEQKNITEEPDMLAGIDLDDFCDKVMEQVWYSIEKHVRFDDLLHTKGVVRHKKHVEYMYVLTDAYGHDLGKCSMYSILPNRRDAVGYSSIATVYRVAYRVHGEETVFDARIDVLAREAETKCKIQKLAESVSKAVELAKIYAM